MIRPTNRPKIDGFDGEFEFLSNFYPSEIVAPDDGITYPTVEHYFQAHKTKDLDERRKIAAAHSPGMAKRAGRAIDLRSDWEQVKVGVMIAALRQKFKDPELQRKLLATGDKFLVEGNTWHDNYWGSCHCKRCEPKQAINQLGEALMATRKFYGGKA